MQIIHAINANLYLSIYYYCHGFWTCLSQHELGLRQKEVLPHGCILLPSSNLLPSSSCFSHGKHSGHRRKVCLPTKQGQGTMETNWPPLSQTQENARCVWEREDGTGTQLSKPQHHYLRLQDQHQATRFRCYLPRNCKGTSIYHYRTINHAAQLPSKTNLKKQDIKSWGCAANFNKRTPGKNRLVAPGSLLHWESW